MSFGTHIGHVDDLPCSIRILTSFLFPLLFAFCGLGGFVPLGAVDMLKTNSLVVNTKTGLFASGLATKKREEMRHIYLT